MEEDLKNTSVNDMDLMRKMNRFMRRARMGSPAEPGMPGDCGMPGPGPEGPGGPFCQPPFGGPGHHGPMRGNPAAGSGEASPMLQGREHRGRPPFEMQEMGQPPVPPCDPQGMHRPPMPPFGPQGMGQPPVPPMGAKGMNRPPLPRENMLVLISENPDGIRQKALSEKMGINQSSTSELVNKLESGGYLVRKVDPDDRRATLLFLTELGQARAAEVRSEQASVLDSMFSRLTEAEKKTLSGLLDKLLNDTDE